MTDDLHDLVGPYALRALSTFEARRFERHLERCAACQVELRGFRATLDHLRTIAPD